MCSPSLSLGHRTSGRSSTEWPPCTEHVTVCSYWFIIWFFKKLIRIIRIPYHCVYCGVERLSLCPENREEKAVEASANEAHKGLTQPEISVWVSPDSLSVKISGAKQMLSWKEKHEYFFTLKLGVHFPSWKRLEWTLKWWWWQVCERSCKIFLRVLSGKNNKM